MIQKLKKMKLFLYICLGLLILNACTFEEEIIKQNGYQEKMKLESKKFSELMQLPAFSNAYKRVINKKVTLSNDLAARTALEDQYGFTIVEGKDVKVITDVDGTIYYNMLIERAIKENLKFENLVIKVVDEEVAAYILKHELNEKALFDSNNESYSYNLKETKIEALNNENITSSRVQVIKVWHPHCIVSYGQVGYCGGNPNLVGIFTENCGHYATVIVTSNDPLPGEGINTPIGTPTGDGIGVGGNGTVTNPNTNPSPNTNPNGETPLTDNTPPIKNVIIPSDEVVELIEKPCQALRRICEPTSSNIKTQIDQLKNKVVANVQKEWGTSIEKIGPNAIHATDDQFTIVASQITEGNQNDTSMDLGETVIASAHLHTSNGVKIFSWKDVYNMKLLYDNVHYNRKKDVTQFLVVANPNNPAELNVYAIKIDNYSIFASKLTSDLNLFPNDAFLYDNLNNTINSHFTANTNAEYAFLSRFSGYGITLYKAMDNNLSEWNKLERGSIGNPLNPGGVKGTPCLTQ